MELPTYTGIWRIEKRLYKLYDFRLPIPLPVGQIAVFAAITVPYIVLLTLFGVPLNHDLFWLYVLPPGLLTWLATRPVLESKRLPELIISQTRYMGEPSTWCRMAPLGEKDEIVVFGRVWRRAAVAPAATAEQEAIEQREAARELPVPERAALPVAAATAQVVSGQPVAEKAVRGRVSTGRRERQARERQARERQARERQRQIREGRPAGLAQGQRVRETAETPGTRWGRRGAGTVRRQGVPGPAVPGSPAYGQVAVPAGEVQRPPAADAGWTRGAGPVADAAVRWDAGAVAPSRAGRGAGPAGTAFVVGYPADSGVRQEGTGVEPRPVGEAGRGIGAGAIGYAGASGHAGRISDPDPVGNGDRSASRSEDPGVAGATGFAGAAGLAGAIGYATGASARPAPDTGAVGYGAGRDGQSRRDAGPGAGVPGTVGYVAGVGARPGGSARDSGPSERAGTGWPTANGAGADWFAGNGAGGGRAPGNGAGAGRPAGNGAGAGVPPGSGSAPGAHRGPRTVAGTGWPAGYLAAMGVPSAATVPGVGCGPAGGTDPAGDTRPAEDVAPASDTGPAENVGVVADPGPEGEFGSAGDVGPAGDTGPSADTGLAGADGTGRGPGHEDRGAGHARAEPGTGLDAASSGGAEPEQAGPQRPLQQSESHPAAPWPSVPPAPAPQLPAPQPPAPRPADPRSSVPPSPALQPSAPPSTGPTPPAPPSPALQPPAPRPAEQQSSAPPSLAPASRPAEPRGWRGHVTVVSGGCGPARPDHVTEARSRAVLPLDRPQLVVVLGCTVGAGQTVTALMLADLLAGLRAEPVAALDLNPGPASLTELAGVPTITVSALLADRAPGAHAAHRGPAGPARGNRTRSRLDVICQDADAGNATMPGLQFDRLAGVLASRYTLTLADPGAPSVAKLLAEAGQLVLVAPASPDAARAVSMTCEWLSGHGHAALAKHSIAVLNGVSQRSVRHAEQAELVLRGRCRAIVRVPWDDHLAEPQAGRGIRVSLEAADGEARLARLRPAVLQAYTALAGVLVSSLGDDPARRKVAR